MRYSTVRGSEQPRKTFGCGDSGLYTVTGLERSEVWRFENQGTTRDQCLVVSTRCGRGSKRSAHSPLSRRTLSLEGHKHCEFSREFWRRRPDLNRGWRFCRLSREAYVVDSSCFLVSAIPSFYPVFGRFWTQVGPKLEPGFSVVRLTQLSSTEGNLPTFSTVPLSLASTTTSTTPRLTARASLRTPYKSDHSGVSVN